MNKNCIFEVKGNKYDVPFPNVGQHFALEAKKITLSSGNYIGFIRVSTTATLTCLAYIDMVAFIEIMIPKLIKDLKVESLLDLGVLDLKDLYDNYYSKQVIPWLDGWYKKLYEKEDKKTDSENKE